MATSSKFAELLRKGLERAAVPFGSTLIVAFSGGPDSSALLAGLVELRGERHLTLVAVNVDHQIRPESSMQEQQSAAAIAESLGVEFEGLTVDVPARASTDKISIESAARTVRYELLADAATRHRAAAVVTGHTRDDQAETVLLHAARGSGLKGISGMTYRSQLAFAESGISVEVARPMLDIPRTLTVDYCDQLGITPVIDSSNSSLEYTRNKLRLTVLPALNEAIPEASRALSRLASNVADDLELIDWVVDQHLTISRIDTHTYSRPKLEDLPGSLISRILMKAYESHLGHALNLERSHISSMVESVRGRSGTRIELPNEVEFYVDKETFGFRFGTDDDCPFPVTITPAKLTLPGTTQLGDGVAINAEIIDRPNHLDAGDSRITFATPDIVTSSINLRGRVNGDRFQPLGMEPEVKLQDFFVGAGVPERWRDRVPIIESERGIVWIAGYRLAEWAKVLPEHDQVARLELVGSRVD